MAERLQAVSFARPLVVWPDCHAHVPARGTDAGAPRARGARAEGCEDVEGAEDADAQDADADALAPNAPARVAPAQWGGGVLGGLARSLLEAMTLASLNSSAAPPPPVAPTSTPAHACTGPGGCMQAAADVWRKLSAEAALSLLLGPPFDTARSFLVSDATAGRSGHGGVPRVAWGSVDAVGLEGGEKGTGATDVAGVVLGEARGEEREVVVLTVVFSQPHLLEWQVASFRCPFSASLARARALSLSVSLFSLSLSVSP